MDWEKKLCAMLDAHQPNWFIDWADQQDLKDAMRDNRTDLRHRVAQRLFHRILNAAIEAGIVRAVE